MANRFSVEAVFKGIDKITAPVTRMQNKVGKFTRKMERDFSRVTRKVNKLGQGIKKGAMIAATGLLIFGAAAGNIIKTGAEFEQTVVSAAAKFPGEIRKGTEAFQQLEAAARKTGATTEFTASQSAAALNFLAKAGFNAQQAIATLPGVVDLATAAEIDLATATDIASDTLGAFGLNTKNTAQLVKNLARVNDVLAKTATSVNVDVEQLFETIKGAGPIANQAGADIETFSALLGVMAGSSIKSSQAGTTLKNVFTRLASLPKPAAEALDRLNVKTSDGTGQMRDYLDIMEDIEKALPKVGSKARLVALDAIFGKRALAGTSAIFATGIDKVRELKKELDNANGASKEMASTMRDTLQGRLNSLTSAIEGVKISIFALNNEALNGAVDKMTEWVRANEKMLAQNIGGFFLKIVNNFGSIVKWIKRIAIGLAVFYALVAVLNTLSLVLTVVNLIMAANPITLWIIGIAALIAIIVLFVFWLNSVKQKIFDTWDKVPGIVKFGLAIAALFTPIGTFIVLTTLIIKHWKTLVNILKFVGGLFVDIGVILKETFDWWLAVLIDIAKNFIQWFNSLPGIVKVAIALMVGPISLLIGLASVVMKSWEPLKGFFKSLWGSIASIFMAAFKKLSPLIDKVTGFGSFIKTTAGFLLEGDDYGDKVLAENQKGNGVVSPQARVAKSIEETRTTSSAEVTIKDDTGRAEVTGGKLGNGIKLQPSGAF